MTRSLELLKTQNEALILSWGCEVNRSLPLIEDLSEVSPQSGKSVAFRASALGYLVALGFGAPSQDVMDDIERFGLLPSLTRREAMLFEKAELSEQERIDCKWLAEGACALAWCLRLVEMDHRHLCSDDLADSLGFGEDPKEVIKSATLRPIVEIQQECDLLYRLHWYARNCGLLGTDSAISESLVRERRRAIDWAYGVEADWDEVPGDT